MSIRLIKHFSYFILFNCLCGIDCNLYINETCQIRRTGAPGICRLIDDCPPIIQEIVQLHLSPTSCGFEGYKQIVCCPDSSSVYAFTTTAKPGSNLSISARSMDSTWFFFRLIFFNINIL